MFAVLDSCFLVGYSANEEGKRPLVESRLVAYAEEGRSFHIPGIAVGETIYVICKKFEEGRIASEERDRSLQSFAILSKELRDSPVGDVALIPRTIAIRSGYGPNRSYDSVFIALAEHLSTLGDTVLATFDERIEHQARIHAPNVRVDCLTVSK